METTELQQAAAEREIYLAEVTRQLSEKLSPLETYESVEEIRGHINAMAAAHEELGTDPLVAMRECLHKFGPAGRLGGSIASASVSKQEFPPFNGAASFGLTLVATWSVAFCLMEAIDASFVYLFRGFPTGIWVSLEISLASSAIVLPLAWFLRRWSALAVASAVTLAFNIFLGFTLYETYFALGEPLKLMHCVISLTVSSFILVLATAKLWKEFKKRFPSGPQDSSGVVAVR